MKEYIEREFIDNLLQKHLDDWCGPEYYATSIIQDEIDEAPSADVTEVVHGHWIKEENSIHCSVCGYITPALIPYVDNGDRWIPLYANKYCGNCGAKMEDE
jgi:hypothetical protein